MFFKEQIKVKTFELVLVALIETILISLLAYICLSQTDLVIKAFNAIKEGKTSLFDVILIFVPIVFIIQNFIKLGLLAIKSEDGKKK